MRSMVPDRIGPAEPISHEVKSHNRQNKPKRHAAKEEALRELRNRQRTAKERQVASARKYLSIATPSSAVAYLGELSMADLELHLLVEEADQNRAFVLSYFPRPGQTARDRWMPVITGQTDVEPTSEAPAPKPRRRASKKRESNDHQEA